MANFTARYPGQGGGSGGGGGVTSLNSETGDVVLVAGTGITVTPAGQDITIASTSQPAGNYITSLTGGVTASGPGAAAATVVTNANLTGPITSVGNATAIASQTGTGTKFVVDTSPTLVTPVLGVASATSLTSPLFSTTASPIANTGNVRLGNAETIKWRNNVDSVDMSIQVDASNDFKITATSASLTGAGGFTAQKLTSTIATGTAPLTVTSTTRVANLNVATAGTADTVTTNANLTGDVTSVGNATTYAGTVPINKGGTAGTTAAAAVNNLIVAPTAVKTGTYAIATTDVVVLVDGTSAFTATLPTAASVAGKTYTIKRVDQTLANAVTIATTSSQTIDGVTTRKLMTQYEQFTVQSDGSNWQILSHTYPSVQTSYTPTYGAGWGTVGTSLAYWQRVGDSIRVRATFTIGTVAANPTTVTLPSGLASALTSASNELVGYVTAGSTTIASDYTVIAVAGATGSVATGRQDGSLAGLASQNGNAIWASGSVISMFFQVPIANWEG